MNEHYEHDAGGYMFIKHYQYIDGKRNLYTQKKSSICPSYYCYEALEDVLGKLFNKLNRDFEYYQSPRFLLIKTGQFSFRLPIPINGELLDSLISSISSQLKIDKENFEKFILDNTDLDKILCTHCLDCKNMYNCNTMKSYLNNKNNTVNL